MCCFLGERNSDNFKWQFLYLCITNVIFCNFFLNCSTGATQFSTQKTLNNNNKVFVMCHLSNKCSKAQQQSYIHVNVCRRERSSVLFWKSAQLVTSWLAMEAGSIVTVLLLWRTCPHRFWCWSWEQSRSRSRHCRGHCVVFNFSKLVMYMGAILFKAL